MTPVDMFEKSRDYGFRAPRGACHRAALSADPLARPRNDRVGIQHSYKVNRPRQVPRVLIRSILFNVLFYLNLLLHFFAAIPTLVLPRRAIVEVARFWARTNLWLLRAVCGIKAEFRGIEKIPH